MCMCTHLQQFQCEVGVGRGSTVCHMSYAITDTHIHTYTHLQQFECEVGVGSGCSQSLPAPSKKLLPKLPTLYAYIALRGRIR
jgi:hypothetical protein